MRLFLFILLVFSSQQTSHAGPNPIIARLMNEPLSMLDYGLWRTELELKRYFASMNNIYVAVRYQWQKDQIAIEVLLSEIPESLKVLNEKDRCKSVIHSIKNYYGIDGIDIDKRDKNRPLDNSLLGKSFIHNGYAGTDVTEDVLFKKLDNITHLYVSIIRSSTIKFNGKKINDFDYASCNSSLLGPEIVYLNSK